MAIGTAEKKRINALIGIIIVLILLLGYFFRESWLPKPQGQTALPEGGPKLVLPEEIGGGVFDKDAYKSLQPNEDVPVKALQSGVKDPFEELKF